MTSRSDAYTFYSLDTPAGPLLASPCLYPEANQERPDIPLSRQCELHQRTWYWCLDLDVAWCDGGPPNYQHHAGRIVAEEEG